MSSRPLEGFVVGITADRRAAEQAEMLTRRGARVVHGPTVRVLPLGPEDGLRAATQSLLEHPPDVVLASTGLGVRTWVAAAASWGLEGRLLQSLGSARLLARGPKAAGAFVTAGLEVAWQAPSERFSDLIDHLLATEVAGIRVAVQLDGGLAPEPARQLRAAGCEVVEVPVYRWTLPEDEHRVRRLVEQASAGHLDAVTFTSAPAVTNLLTFAESWGAAAELRRAFEERVRAVCVGPVCREVALKAGFRGAIAPDRARLGSMLATLTSALAGERRDYSIAGHRVAVQGSRLVINGKAASMTNREREVLEVLVGRAGAVVTKRHLLIEVWGTAQADPHALEVAVARLRRRLGPAAAGLQTVIRRGYRLDAAAS
ncbi:MAG: uroporphyrinogen-III synthase [Actinobacteria bacterium]|nr:uroporphyrinogen-III synthase [Actinomycetota bacterium]